VLAKQCVIQITPPSFENATSLHSSISFIAASRVRRLPQVSIRGTLECSLYPEILTLLLDYSLTKTHTR